MNWINKTAYEDGKMGRAGKRKHWNVMSTRGGWNQVTAYYIFGYAENVRGWNIEVEVGKSMQEMPLSYSKLLYG